MAWKRAKTRKLYLFLNVIKCVDIVNLSDSGPSCGWQYILQADIMKNYKMLLKSPAYGRHQLSRPMLIVGPIQVLKRLQDFSFFIYILIFFSLVAGQFFSSDPSPPPTVKQQVDINLTKKYFFSKRPTIFEKGPKRPPFLRLRELQCF